MTEFPPNQPENAPPRRPNSTWKWLIAAGVLAAVIISFALSSFLPSSSTQTGPENIPAPNLTPSLTPAPQSKTMTFVLFVPNDNAELSQQKMPDESTPNTAPYEVKAKRALELLFPRLESLPPRVKLLSAPKKEKSGVVRVDLSKEFTSLNSQPEGPVMLVLDAMARTLGALESADGKNLKSAKMQITIEGKTVSTLSEFALDEPWTASETIPDTPNPEDAV